MSGALYHLTILPPTMEGCEAVTQQVASLRAHFGGDLVYLNPNHRSPLYVPRLAFGFDRLHVIRSYETGIDLHHVFNPDPFAFPVLRLLRRPIVYSLTGALAREPRIPRFLSSLPALTVADERSLAHARAEGLDNVRLVRTGLDTTHFSHTPLALHSQFRLLVGSAPWSRAQFHSKGVDALLGAARACPDLHLTFLWRGVFLDEMERRVRHYGVGEQVRVLNERVDVNQVLAGVHGSVALATDPSVIHPYPHSLIESLAAGKPVLTSRSIPMSDYVAGKELGCTIDHVTPSSVLSAIEQLRARYPALQRAALTVGGRDFGLGPMIRSYEQAYARAV
jgi:glycosyltransferase involved in cell wall biosynthesis